MKCADKKGDTVEIMNQSKNSNDLCLCLCVCGNKIKCD